MNLGNDRNYPSLQKSSFQQNSSVNLLMELNQIKKDLKSTTISPSYQRSALSPRSMMMSQRDNYSSLNPAHNSKNDYILGNSNTRDIVNESRNDFQLPVQSQDVDITRISYSQYNNPSSGYNNFVPTKKSEMERYSEPQSFNRHTNQSFNNSRHNYEMKNSFVPSHYHEPSNPYQDFKYKNN